MKLFKYITIVALLVSVAACSVNEENFPVDLDTVLNTNGAYLRVLEVESAGFDILDLDNAAYIFMGEVWDREEGDLFESVEFYVSYSGADGTELEETGPFKSYTASDFARGGLDNLLQNRFVIDIQEVLQPLGLTTDDLLIGDSFRIRWDVNLSDGRTFSVDDANPDISGGSFFRSPYVANANVVAAIPEDQFVGSYTFTQNSPAGGGVASAFFGDGWILEGAQSFTTDISVNPDNTLNGRVFSAEPYPQFGGLAVQDFFFNLALANDPANNTVTITGSVGSGIGCSALGISYGPASSGSGDFDPADDSEFTLVIRENAAGDCGVDSPDVEYTVTKN